MNTKQIMTKLFIDTVKNQVEILCKGNEIDFKANKKPISEYFKENATEHYNKAILTASEDSKQADFLDGLSEGKVHKLVKEAFNISFNHSCLKFSEKIVEFLLNR